MHTPQKIIPMLWFDNQAEEAAMFYTGVFRNSKICDISRFPNVGQEVHGRPAGSVMVVSFELDGQKFTALNGGPVFKFNEATSFVIYCDSQEEIDYFWERLGEGGDPSAQACGWLKDKYGLSWQVTPRILPELLTHADTERAAKVFAAMMKMSKLDIAELRRAGGEV